MKLRIAIAVLAFFGFSFAAMAADHVVEISLSVSKGAVGSHFSIYHGRKVVEIDGKKIEIPYTSSFTKVCARDDSTDPKRVTPGKPWNCTAKFAGGGIFIFDISDWDNDPNVTVQVKVDGQVVFKGSGTGDDYDKWTDKFYGKGVRKTDNREVAFQIE